MLYNIRLYGKVLYNMKKVSTAEFRGNMNLYLADLPIALTLYGKTIAVISAYAGGTLTIKKIGKSLDKAVRCCKHGSRIGLCKHDCKK